MVTCLLLYYGYHGHVAAHALRLPWLRVCCCTMVTMVTWLLPYSGYHGYEASAVPTLVTMVTWQLLYYGYHGYVAAAVLRLPWLRG